MLKPIWTKLNIPLDIVNAGDHCDLSISRQIEPLLFIFGWYILVVKATCKEQPKLPTVSEFIKHDEPSLD